MHHRVRGCAPLGGLIMGRIRLQPLRRPPRQPSEYDAIAPRARANPVGASRVRVRGGCVNWCPLGGSACTRDRDDSGGGQTE